MKKHILSILSLILSLTMVLTACGDSGTPAPSGDDSSGADPAPVTVVNPALAQDDNTLYVGTTAQGGTFNPLYASSSYDVQTIDLIYERLVEVTDEGHQVANERLVTEMTVSEDGLTYTFKIKEGITFSNGTPLTANDIVFTYKALMDPSCTGYRISIPEPLKGYTAYRASETEDFEAVVAIDDHTVEFHFEKNLRTNLAAASMYIISADYFPEWTYNNSDNVIPPKHAQPIGTGPYVLEAFDAKQSTTLSKNPTYWAADITDYKIERIVVVFVESSNELDYIVAGQIDVLPITIELAKVDRVRNDEDGKGTDKYLELVQFMRSAYGFFQFNTEHVSDVALRQAIAYLTPRDEYNEAEYGDLANTIDVPMSQASSVYSAVLGELVHYEYSPEKALEVLTAAGYTQEGGKLLDPEGKPVEMLFLKTANNSVLDVLYPLVEQSFTEIGITLKEETMEFAAMMDIFTQEDAAYDILFMANSWTSDEPDTWKSSFGSSNIPNPNRARYSNPEIDRLLEEGAQILDITDPEAVKIYSEIAKILNNDLPQIPIYANTLTSIINTRVKGLRVGTFREWSRGIEGAYIDESDAGIAPEGGLPEIPQDEEEESSAA